MMEMVVNGRFLCRPTLGVDRVARELVAALLARRDAPALRALHPEAEAWDVPAALSATAVPGPGSGALWEQAALARATEGRWCLSLCNTGPLALRRQVVMLHDAQAWDAAESYRPAFRRWYRWLQPRLARRAALVLTVSQHSRARLERHGVVPEGHAQVIPNGADHILRTDADPRILERHDLQRRGFFLTLGAQARHKNLALAIDAHRLSPERLPLVIAGGGGSVFAGHETPDPPGVLRIGRVSDAELRALYEHAAGFLMPSRTEGFGLPALEAMLCGCPVLASTGGALPETCGEAAVLLDPDAPEAWSRKMTRLLRAPSHAAALSEAGRAHARRYTWAASAERLARHLAALPS
ncbi:glycosyltransferase family 4 protein [Litorisediminicola beolgyonensis]|uniref:Glycosyltransferase family 4 protein n=1 Tax=Litorisediminicola beolgyonensis TaxID=1173614 RepID=A0ABW3ZIX5_9RHOB